MKQRQYFTVDWQAAVRGIYSLAAVQPPGRTAPGTGSGKKPPKNSEFRFKPKFRSTFPELV